MESDLVFQKIIVGDNGTPDAEHAVATAIALAEKLGASVVLLGVIPPPSPESQAEGYALKDPAGVKQQLSHSLDQTVEAAKARGVQVVAKIVEGDPEQQLEKEAEQEGADLIVIGRRHVSRLRHWLERSTGEALLNKAKASVLVVHSSQQSQPIA